MQNLKKTRVFFCCSVSVCSFYFCFFFSLAMAETRFFCFPFRRVSSDSRFAVSPFRLFLPVSFCFDVPSQHLLPFSVFPVPIQSRHRHRHRHRYQSFTSFSSTFRACFTCFFRRRFWLHICTLKLFCLQKLSRYYLLQNRSSR